MIDELDPAQMQEGAGADEADPQASAESPEESGEGAGAGEGAPQNNQDGPSAELEIVVAGEAAADDEPPPKAAEAWVKARHRERDLKAKVAELERKIQATGQPAGAPDPGPEPTLEDDDVAFDQAALKAKYAKWLADRQAKADSDAKTAKAAEAWQAKKQAKEQAYTAKRVEAAARFPDYDDRERRVMAVLDGPRQRVILEYAKDATLVVAAIGQNPSLAEGLRTEEDPLLLVDRLRELEAKLSTRPKSKTPPPPEKKISGSGSSSAGDSTLEQLRAKADKDGNRTPVTDYLRKKREASR